MRFIFGWQSVLRAPAGEHDGGGGGTAIHPGAPVEVGADTLKPVEKPAEKSDAEKSWETEREQLRRERDEARNSERYWADRARGSAPREPDPNDDPEEQTLPIRREAAKPEEFLDDLSKDPDGALKKRGVITQEELQDALRKERERSDARLARTQAHTALDATMGREFPELLEDNARMNRGEKAKNPLTARTSEVFREMVAEDPSLEKSPAAILTAARVAKKLMKAEEEVAAATRNSRQSDRRERIDNQRGERINAGGTEQEDENADMSPQVRQIVGHLSKYIGDNPENKTRTFARQDAPVRRNGRG